MGENPFRKYWGLDEETVFINHGSFGATPLPVLGKQEDIRKRMEKQPLKFFMRDYEGLYLEAREALAALVGAGGEDIAFVQNATTGVNTALRSVPLSRGDEILVTDQEYNACRNALNEIAAEKGVSVRELHLPFPVSSRGEITEKVLGSLSERTRVLLIDHVVSQTALVIDVHSIVRELKERDIETIVDGAHALGMLRLDLGSLKPAFYTSNAHKWLCAPKGAAFLYVREDMRERTRPLVISHGANSPRRDVSRFFSEFSWTGTQDPSAFLSVPFAIDFLDSLMPGGLEEVMKKNRSLCLRAREMILRELDTLTPCPDEMVGAMASFPLPDASLEPRGPLFIDALQEELYDRFSIEVPVMHWPKYPKRLIRISAQLYNSMEDYEKLCEALHEMGL